MVPSFPDKDNKLTSKPLKHEKSISDKQTNAPQKIAKPKLLTVKSAIASGSKCPNGKVFQVGVDQNYGPFLGLYYSIFLTVQGTERGP